MTRDYCLHEFFNASCKQPTKQLYVQQHALNNYLNNKNIIKNNKPPASNFTLPDTKPFSRLQQNLIELKSVLLLKSAVYGRMRIGRCVLGDFNTGCSMSVTYYVDSQCSGREACDMSVRNLVDIHPCPKDFTSYLEASYTCIDGLLGWCRDGCC